MDVILTIQTSEALADLASLDGLPPLSPDLFRQHAPDAHWVVLRDDRAIAAYCSLWWTHTPPYGDEQVGLIGHYAAQDADAAQLLLHHGCQQLLDQGCTLAIAPMDGNTWRRYRLLSQRGPEPLFFLEPDNPDDWCDHMAVSGFTALATYSSALNTDLMQIDHRLVAVKQRLQNTGVTVRSLDMQHIDQELAQIHQLSLISFRRNILYTPIESTEFVAQYSQIIPYVQPQLVLMAEQDKQLVGFLFAIPDLLQAQRGDSINTVIIKTVAVLPGRHYAGLGNVLVAQVQAIAHQLGYTRAIHALMHDGNNSRNLSDRYAHTIRRYTLFSKRLL
jgi:GNAT superfamily N-acetyltransferase